MTRTGRCRRSASRVGAARLWAGARACLHAATSLLVWLGWTYLGEGVVLHVCCWHVCCACRSIWECWLTGPAAGHAGVTVFSNPFREMADEEERQVEQQLQQQQDEEDKAGRAEVSGRGGPAGSSDGLALGMAGVLQWACQGCWLCAGCMCKIGLSRAQTACLGSHWRCSWRLGLHG
jgi:hypothetical protein